MMTGKEVREHAVKVSVYIVITAHFVSSALSSSDSRVSCGLNAARGTVGAMFRIVVCCVFSDEICHPVRLVFLS